jgi:hypothetical protein
MEKRNGKDDGEENEGPEFEAYVDDRFGGKPFDSKPVIGKPIEFPGKPFEFEAKPIGAKPLPELQNPVDPEPNCEGAKIQGRVRTARFTAWNDRRTELEAAGVKLTGVNATVAQDLEPEYTTFSQDEKVAFVSLQVRQNSGLQLWELPQLQLSGYHLVGSTHCRQTAADLHCPGQFQVPDHPAAVCQ